MSMTGRRPLTAATETEQGQRSDPDPACLQDGFRSKVTANTVWVRSLVVNRWSQDIGAQEDAVRTLVSSLIRRTYLNNTGHAVP